MLSARLIPRHIADALVLSAVLVFCSRAFAAETPKKPAEPAVATPQGNSSAAVDPIGKVEPPDGVWLKDEEGREYYVDRIPKDEGFYRRIDDKTVKTRWGVVIHVDHEDDKSFYYRLYRPMEVPLSVPPPPTAEQLAAARQSYVFETKESDRLTFQAFSSGLPQRGQWRNGFDLADMNGDGNLDIVHGSARKTRSVPQVFLHDGKGSWSNWEAADFPPLSYDYGDAVAGDLNGDGRNDMVLGVHLHGILVLLNEGRGKFKSWGEGVDFRVPSSGVEPVFSSRAVALADWNRDGKLDIIAFGEGPRLATDRSAPTPANSSGLVIYLNQGNGQWLRKDQGTDSYQLFGDHLLVSDIDGDGHPDALTTSNTFGRTDILNLSRADGSWQNYHRCQARGSCCLARTSSG